MEVACCTLAGASPDRDRKSTRLNSSHQIISYAVFCLKKKNTSNKASNQIISYALFCFKQINARHNLVESTPEPNAYAQAEVTHTPTTPSDRVACDMML